MLDARGEVVIVIARLVPAEILAAAMWAAFACAIGYVGGQAFRDSLWKPLLLGTLLAVLIGAVAETVRRRRLAG